MLTKGWLHGPLEFIVTNFSGGGTRYRSFRTMLPLLRTPAVLLLFLSVMSPAAAAQWRINLQPVVTSGLTQPVLVTSARDGSGRLFIVEQPGRIRVLQPNGTGAGLFLDISPKVLSGGERGLLGLTFHPQYSSNGRFFVDYTRQPDGATVIAEYRASPTNPDAADPGERILLTIPQPFENHNGGMVEFGPDGYLYIGMGDGGSANDPGDRAQNPQELLGKILRIDVDRSGGGTEYAIPPSNPFLGSPAFRPEIYALGLRNPWRYSFDRATGRMNAGDVGQDQVEEIDIIVSGGNYGWRVLEGLRCTNLGPASCASPMFVPPIAQYTHEGGRCSITGGYVYRGRRESLPQGDYVYADYCTGEIFMLDSGNPVLLLSSGLNISSFGEDEDGEIYVAGLGGTVHRIVNPDAPPKPTYYFPPLVGTSGQPAGENEFNGFAATNLDTAPASLTFTAYDANGIPIQGTDIHNPTAVELQSGAQLALLDTQIFGAGLKTVNRLGWVQLESSTAQLATFYSSFDAGLSFLDGAAGTTSPLRAFILPEVAPADSWVVHLANPHALSGQVIFEVVSQSGSSRTTAVRTLGPKQLLAESMADLFPNLDLNSGDYVRGSASQGIAALESLEEPRQLARTLNAQDATGGGKILFAPQYAVGAGYRSVLSVTNMETMAGNVTFRLVGDDGTTAGAARVLSIAGRGKIVVDDPAFFGSLGTALTQGYVEIRSDGPLLSGCVTFSDSGGQNFSTAMPLVSSLHTRLIFSQVASDATYYSGIALVNPATSAATVRIEVLDPSGQSIAMGDFAVPALGRKVGVLTTFFPALAGSPLSGGYVLIRSVNGIAGCAVVGTNNLTSLTGLVAQILRD